MATRASRAICWLFLLATFSAPAMAQLSVPCGAFQRGILGWIAVEPAAIDVPDGTLEVMPGHLVGANVARILNALCR